MQKPPRPEASLEPSLVTSTNSCAFMLKDGKVVIFGQLLILCDLQGVGQLTGKLDLKFTCGLKLMYAAEVTCIRSTLPV